MLQLQNAARGHLCRRPRHIRTFVNARIKWVRDPYLDTAVEREKNLKPLLSLKNLILSQPSQTLPLSSVSPLRPDLQIPTSARKFFLKYPLIFKIFLPPHKSNSLPHVKLTPRLLSLHHDEILILNTPHYRKDVAERLVRLLMLARAGKLPLYMIDMFKYDLGLPHDYLSTLLLEFPDYFSLCDMGFRDSSGSLVLGLELVSWRDDMAVPVMEKRSQENGEIGTRTKFSMNLPRGFDLEKKVMAWLDEWQKLPYISPYENAFHLIPNSDLAEKWAVAVIHELLSLLVSRKTERNNIFCLGEFLGFGRLRLKRALVHFPGIFYVSNKIKTQTVLLREEYRKNMLVGMHPLMLMRNKYISLMNLVLRRGKPIRTRVVERRKGSATSSTGGEKKDDQNRYTLSDNDIY
ncbi:protein WHAT'S THIS FACTOR 9, mitochondrial [Primulina tabacum]|uniref:protein WHAT'S THIS FACTOR 9, mitochondrial n=1 Tax=Primulina tabacum TaxID=48773 RepID=UPI003F5A5825